MRGVSRFPVVVAALAVLAVPGALLAHGKAVMGTVTAVDVSSIEIKTTDGKTVRVKVTDKTKYMKGNAEAISSDVKPGVKVSIHLTKDGSAGEVHLAPDSGSMKQ